MKVLLLLAILMMSGCASYQCGNIANGMGDNPYDFIGILTDAPLAIGEALVCPENIK